MTENYNDQYIETVFHLWYNGGRKISQRFCNTLPDDDRGNRPTWKTVEKWRDSYGWIERADGMDAALSLRLEDEAISKRIEMYKEHVEVSNALIAKGKEFLQNHSIEEMGDALKAISLGIDIQKASIGQIEMGQKILRMSDDQLTKEINKLLGKPDTVSEFIDATVEEIDE